MNIRLQHTLSSYVDAFRPIIYISHFDFIEVKKTICSIDSKAQCIEFDCAMGRGAVSIDTPFVNYTSESTDLIDFLNQVKDEGYDRDTFIILKDIHGLIDGERKDMRVISLLKYISERTLYAENYHTTIFILSDILAIPHELENYISIMDYPLPELKEIVSIITNFAKDLQITVDQDVVDTIALSLKGLNEFQITQILNLAYQNGGDLRKDDEQLILKEKEQFIKKSGMLEIIKVKETKEDIGGLEILKEWLYQKAKIFSNLDKALKFGADVPKGILIVGKPGCGKSLTAKATAALFKIPLVRLDVGHLLGKYVGESEENMRKALRLSEAISPCVLWVDEIEKAFAGVLMGGDGGVTTRLFGQFLTWMQEKDNTVFIVATANNILSLQPEFLRKGRFDELFYVDYPNQVEREQIIKIHLKKRKQWHTGIDVKTLAKKTYKYSGSDIEAVVKDAVECAFVRALENMDDLSDVRLSTKEIEQSINKIVPLSLGADEDKIKEMITKLGVKLASKTNSKVHINKDNIDS